MEDGLLEKIRAAGGEIYAVTGEPQALAMRARADWELDFEAVGDPHHEISQTCADRGHVELVVNDRFDFLQREADFELQHPKGYFQPGVLAIATTGRVLYRWRSIPTRRNNSGASERPTAAHAWSSIEAALAQPDDSPDAPLDADPPLDGRGAPFALFFALLVANGWFLRAKAFTHSEGAPSALRRIRFAALRLPVPFLFWGVAFWALPTPLSVAGLAAWSAWMGKEFQIVRSEFQVIEAT